MKAPEGICLNYQECPSYLTGRQQSMQRQYWAEVVPVVYQPLAFVRSTSWIADSTVCRYRAWLG